jgi:hypothetical protein
VISTFSGWAKTDMDGKVKPAISKRAH